MEAQHKAVIEVHSAIQSFTNFAESQPIPSTHAMSVPAHCGFDVD